PTRHTGGLWKKLECGDFGGCTATLTDGTKLYASGIVTSSQSANPYVWANLSNFSVYGIQGSVYGVAGSVYGVAGAIEHAISISSILVPDSISAGSTIILPVALLSKASETGAFLRLINLPEGWTSSEVYTGMLYPGTSEREITLTIPAGAAGVFNLMLEVEPRDFYGVVQKAVSLVVGEVPGAPMSTTTPKAEPTQATLKPQETPAATITPKVTPVVGGEGKGICGPSIITLLALVPSFLWKRRIRR
ncbi:CGP-CTERM sorting domain-containing protein, partial [archaeon]|nr:CGP-CTERM sorting domain-containing protein [archaeon]